MINRVFVLLALMLASVSCPALAKTASVTLTATQPGSNVSGSVLLEETEGGLKVTANVKNIPAGKHGFHFHENGSCADAGNAAGSHFNPDAVSHGLLSKDGFTGAHAGDLGNLEVAPNGSGTYEAVIPGLSLSEGAHNVSGRSVILHAKEDDFGQPTGNAGDRVACGVIR